MKKGHWEQGYAADVKLARLIGPTEAKLTLVVSNKEHPGQSPEHFIIIYLRYYDGVWTTTHWEAGNNISGRSHTVLVLTSAIDRAGGK
jgi:hypothetical protein